MNSKLRKTALIILLIIAVAIVAFYYQRNRTQTVRAELVNPQAAGFVGLSETAEAGFARAEVDRPFIFPQDYGPHPDFQTEWWYYTGNLDSADDRHFGYQLTFFRRALQPPDLRRPRRSDWTAEQVYMAHFAITDVSQKEHHSFERLTRGAAGLAGAQAEPYKVWLEDWSVMQQASHTYRLKAAQAGLVLDLTLVDLKGPILQGQEGFSWKGPNPGNASYYYSLTHLKSSGSVTIRGDQFQVSGASWMDHEFSTSALSAEQIGWDWFSIQLDNNEELMLFQIRRADGSIDPFSSGNIVYADGSTHLLQKDDFKITIEDNWRSPRSGSAYPSRWKVDLPSENLTVELVPYLDDQEMNVSYIYWEGAVQVKGALNSQPITGHGYVEMTGYSQPASDH